MLKVTISKDNQITSVTEVNEKVMYIDMKIEDHPVINELGEIVPFSETSVSKNRIKELSSKENLTFEEFLEYNSLNGTVDKITQNDIDKFIPHKYVVRGLSIIEISNPNEKQEGDIGFNEIETAEKYIDIYLDKGEKSANKFLESL